MSLVGGRAMNLTGVRFMAAPNAVSLPHRKAASTVASSDTSLRQRHRKMDIICSNMVYGLIQCPSLGDNSLAVD
jgi:hypothetical protein